VRMAPDAPGRDAGIVQLLAGERQLSPIADPPACSRVLVLDRAAAPRPRRLVGTTAFVSGDPRPQPTLERTPRSLHACFPHRRSWVHQQHSRSWYYAPKCNTLACGQ
jgi:hypothetical protein